MSLGGAGRRHLRRDRARALDRLDGTVDANVAPRTYSAAVGGRARGRLILPLRTRRPERDPVGLLDLLDALVLSGGADIDPALYGAEPAARDQGHRPRARRLRARAWPRGAIERDLPLLGVCRGMQLLNVACGAARSSRT